MKRTRSITLWLARILMVGAGAVPLMTGTGSGCGGTAGSICEAVCDCQLCNDREEDECIIDADRSLDIADAYGCSEEADALADCVIENNDCDDNVFQVDPKCSDDLEDLYDCINDNSDLDNGQGPPNPDPPNG